MVLPNNVKRDLEDHLCKWIENLTKRKTEEYAKSTDDNTSDKNKPFHKALLLKDVIRTVDFERSFSTGLGSTFEECVRTL